MRPRYASNPPRFTSCVCIEHDKPARYMELNLMATAGARICRPIGRRRREAEKERARRDHDMRRHALGFVGEIFILLHHLSL